MEVAAIVTERDCVVELLKLYRESTCLWDPKDEYYDSKIKKQAALERILQCWRKNLPTANVHTVKRKIENLRTAYKREKRKVDKSIEDGDPEVYQPKLWYYPLMTFLNGGVQRRGQTRVTSLVSTGSDQTPDFDDNTGDAEYLEASSEEEDEATNKHESVHRGASTHEPSLLRAHLLSGSPAAVKTEIVHSHASTPDPDNKTTHQKCRRISKKRKESFESEKEYVFIPNEDKSAEVFGTSVSLQLSELSQLQRCVAEKLISDILFYAKLDKLTINTTIKLQT